MKALNLIFLLLIVTFTTTYAQRTLEVKEKTEALSVFTDKNTSIDNTAWQAGVTISCSTTLFLSFASNIDKSVDVYKIEEKGGLSFYYLRFIVGKYKGASYENRILEIFARDFRPLRLALELKPSEFRHFEVYDPNATVGVGCFYQHYNEGVELFKKSFYAEALEKFQLSMNCTDKPEDVNVKAKIAIIDSIQTIKKRADYLFDMLNYRDALENYQRILSYNSEDRYASTRLNESRIKFVEVCNNYYYNAENYFFNGKYLEAKKLYQIVLEQACNKSVEANLRLIEIRNAEADRNQRVQAILYEFAPNTPLGISAGKYSENKICGYFSMRLNKDLFEAIRKDYELAKKPEINISFGWTIKVYKPVWIFFGPGYTGKATWDYRKSKDDPKIDIHNAISPEIGLLGKIGPVALRYTLQYRFALEKEQQDYIKKFKHVIGIGVCF